jgi:hypothetical protein
MGDSQGDADFGVAGEPWRKPGGFAGDPSESVPPTRDDRRREIDRIRDSVFNEPGHTRVGPGRSEFAAWLAARRNEASRPVSFAVGLLAAVMSGPFAFIGALIAGRQTAFAVVYLVLFGPITEELLKQSGMIYLVERLPYRVFTRWQLVIGAVVGALIFASVENLIYLNLYFAGLPAETLTALAAFRWRVCTALHVFCSLIASLGLVKVWRQQTIDARPANLAVAFPYFAVAIAVHGLYNLIAVLTRGMWFF